MNKYHRWYDFLVQKAKRAERSYDSTIHENHHIIPRCFGGSDDADNLVTFTHREHFIAHRLLVKMYEGQNKYKMAWALSLISSKHRHKNSRHFEVARKELSKALTGVPKSEEWKRGAAERCKKNNPAKNRTPEERKAYAKAASAKRWKGHVKKEYVPTGRSVGAQPGHRQPESQKRKVAEANSKRYRIRTPEGEEILIKNLRKTGRELGFDQGNLLKYGKAKGFVLLEKLG